jgi:hypothetical protein
LAHLSLKDSKDGTMPAKSKAQQRLFAIAEHNPSALYAKNAKLADLPKSTQHEFAATKSKGLPKHVKSAGTPNRYGRIGR